MDIFSDYHRLNQESTDCSRGTTAQKTIHIFFGFSAFEQYGFFSATARQDFDRLLRDLGFKNEVQIARVVSKINEVLNDKYGNEDNARRQLLSNIDLDQEEHEVNIHRPNGSLPNVPKRAGR